MKLILYADGGCWPNPGPGTFGVVAEVDGRVVCRMSKAIGPATCNIAEWRGAIAALSYAKAQQQYDDIELRMDSQLVVNQLNGRWRVKNAGLRDVAAEGRRLFLELNLSPCQCIARWVPRHQNAEADRLATLGRDRWSTQDDEAALAHYARQGWAREG